MFPRALEVLLIALLVIMTLGVAFQIQNNLLLRDILREFRRQPNPVIITQGNTQPSNQPQPLVPNPAPQPYDYYPQPNPAPAPNVQPQPAPAQQPPANPAPAVEPPASDTTQPLPPAPVPVPPSQPETQPSSETSEGLTAEQDAEWKKIGKSITGVITNLLNGDYDRVRQQFDRNMSANLSRQQLAAAIEPLRTEHGDFKKVLYHRPVEGELPKNMHAWEVNVELGSGHQVLFTVTVDDKDRVAGLLMK